MADEDVNGNSDEVQQEKSLKKTAKYDSGAADLEKVTDYAEEREISSSEGLSCVSRDCFNTHNLLSTLEQVIYFSLDFIRVLRQSVLITDQSYISPLQQFFMFDFPSTLKFNFPIKPHQVNTVEFYHSSFLTSECTLSSQFHDHKF